jgi:hypothetical protein
MANGDVEVDAELLERDDELVAGEDAPGVVFCLCDCRTTGATGEIKAHWEIESASC